MSDLMSIFGTPTMANAQYEKGKIRLDFSKNQIKKAGESIRKEGVTNENVQLIQNYRAAHLYPLMIIKNLVWKHIQKIAPNAIIARRLKRLPTIIDKLTRDTLDGINKNTMCVTRMQDIGGCRVIVDNKEQLLRVNSSLEQSRTLYITKLSRDYNINPKKTGYRGIHRVYQCYGKRKEHDWKGFTIELQLRTRLQHLWATTVEVVDLCEGKTLKTNPYDADPRWIAFFREMSDFLADEDGFISLSNEQKKQSLIALNEALNAQKKLESFNLIFSGRKISHDKNKYRYAIIGICLSDKTTHVNFFGERKKHDAIRLYSEIEKNDLWNGLFVEMSDIWQLQYAYPNYLIDTHQFVEKLKSYTESSYWTQPLRFR
ncbi:Region found in RelA / SpoT proteins [Sodalis glossinidius str. 'morsitans']|uniref:Region found in RelA / SpoT proteins n=1 Tax=Sodalis glossinidius (strain morsitans) TaxID=343509 RepID=A0A193QI37_SODGM|nr:RelA/SpoT domain-containing protein [Sodalis glossinidius]CRL44788.1 Region found in RelA / SpoT proteins [Sodalis glossinidius str. 'morsitans']